MNVLTASIQDCQGEHVVIFSFLLNSQPIYPGFCYCCLSNCMHTVKSLIKNDTVQIEGSRKYLIFLKRTEKMNLWGGEEKNIGCKRGVTKNSFKFCNDGICNCANRLPQCQKPVSEWSLTLQVFLGSHQPPLHPSFFLLLTSLCTRLFKT